MSRLPPSRWVCSAMALLLAACVETTAPQLEPTVDGFWLGQSQGWLIALDLVQEDGVVTGTGTVMRYFPVPFDVRNGSKSSGGVDLIADPSPDYTAFRLSGEVFPGRIAATLNGSGFRDFDIYLRRY